MIRVTDMTISHVYELAKDLRGGDVLECAALGHTPRQSLRKCYRESMIRKSIFVDGILAACYGATGTVLGPVLYPWLLTGQQVDKAFLSLALLYRAQVREFLKNYPRLENYCDARYTKSLNLLRLVGFRVEEPQPFGKLKMPFCKFWIEA